jgi:cystathionine beta-synthase
VDPEGSVISGGAPHAYQVEGIGDDFVPSGLDTKLIDDYVRVTDAECFHWARRLAREEGILAGGSSGAAVLAAVQASRGLPRDANVVAILADTGRNYLSKFYDDAWLAKIESPAKVVVR